MDLSSVGIDPERTADPNHARTLIERDGAVILSRAGLTEADARAVGFSVFNRSLLAVPSGVKVSDAGDKQRRPAGQTHRTRSPCHTSGYSYGEHYPDFVVLLCQWQSPVGGESILVDGLALLDQMSSDPLGSGLLERLRTTPVDQTDPGMRPLVRPIVAATDRGRLALVTANAQHVRPHGDSARPDADQEMIDQWRSIIDKAADQIPKVKVNNGEALIIDNYRVLHGREPYEDTRRLMWRVWLWTDDAAHGTPVGPLHSDSRHALAG